MNYESNLAKDRHPIHKAKGITPSERYLNSLCESTFLSLWSYPGVFRDQRVNGKGDGKELCDMLVVFDEHVLIFSDKHCEFPSTGDKLIDWKRWYKRAIEKSASQAWGAERWLRNHLDRVFLDRRCEEKFPLAIPQPENAKFHLVVIAHGCEERCKAEFGGSGSLMFNSTLGQQGKQELTSRPFMVGDLDRTKTFVHILTKTTMDILLHTLDTISDFIWYLEKKEKFIRSLRAVILAGEEELLAFYLVNLNDEGFHDFIIDDKYDTFGLEEGFWEEFRTSQMRKNQLVANKISYGWDELIERFSYHALNATQYYTNHLELSDTEKGLRLMARESRTQRRMIMKAILEIFSNTPNGMRRTKFIKPLFPGGAYYVFLCLPRPDFLSYEDYRKARGSFLEACVNVMKYEFPEALDIVGIASEPIQVGPGTSEDLIYMDAREWSDELNREAAKLQKKLNIFTKVKASYAKEFEFPE